MKINMRTVQQALNIGQRIYREWNKYQNQKNKQQGTDSRPSASSNPYATGYPAGNGAAASAPSSLDVIETAAYRAQLTSELSENGTCSVP